MKVKFLAIVLIAFPLLACTFRGSGKGTLYLNTISDYKTEGWLYNARGEEKPVGIVYLHGKSWTPGEAHNYQFIRMMTKAGYKVMAPVMPWSERRYEGTREQGLEIVDAAIEALGKARVVVIGHSMGGMGVIQYGARGPHAKVIGLIAVAPGHDPNLPGKLGRFTKSDAEIACAMMREGKGKVRRYFVEFGNKEYEINATVEYYCTYYSVAEYPDTGDIVSYIKIPLLWVAAEDDRRTTIYDMKSLFEGLPRNDKNNYLELPGDHTSVLYMNVDAILQWIDGL